MKKSIYLLFTLFSLSIAFIPSEEVECFLVEDENSGVCAVACTDNTLYIMDCEADIFQQN